MKTLQVAIISAFAVTFTAVGSTESPSPFKTIKLEGKGFDGINHTAALTRITGVGDMFWLFWESFKEEPTSRPLILWLEGITGVPPSLRVNIETLGPIWLDGNVTSETWVNYFNLLLVDSPIGTGFSKAVNPSNISTNFDDHVDYLVYVVQSFYELHKEYENTPLYIFGQAHGAQFAVALGTRLAKVKNFRCNIVGVALENAIISPTPSLSHLGSYLEIVGLIDSTGRTAVDGYADKITKLVNNKQYKQAFDLYLSIDKFVNGKGGGAALDLTFTDEKASHEPRGVFGGRVSDAAFYDFVENTLQPALGIPEDIKFDEQRTAAVKAFRSTLMKCAVDKVECLLTDTNVTLYIYNGVQDAILNTAGQLEWIEKLQWQDQKTFLQTPRTPLIIGSYLLGHVRKTPRLQFYWLKYAGEEPEYTIYYSFTRLLFKIMNVSY